MSGSVSCSYWSENSNWWLNGNNWWSVCVGSGSYPFIPTQSLSPQPLGVDATTLIQPWLIEPWNPYRDGEIKKKKLVRLIVKINNETYDDEKKVGNMKVLVEDVKIIMKNQLEIIDLKLLNEEIGKY